MIVGVILAGGASLRMGQGDKAYAMFRGKRLVDHVYARFNPQVMRCVISGSQEYGLGLDVVDDNTNGFAGPVQGVLSVAAWLRAHHPAVRRFVTVPVDGAFLPMDIVHRLTRKPGSAIASTTGFAHPTFACWDVGALEAAMIILQGENSVSLHMLATTCNARAVLWNDERVFLNINSYRDLQQAEESSAKGD